MWRKCRFTWKLDLYVVIYDSIARMAFTLHGSLSISLNSHGHSHTSSNDRLHVKVNGPKTNTQQDEVPSFFIEHSDRR